MDTSQITAGTPLDPSRGVYFSRFSLANSRCFGEEPTEISFLEEEDTPARWTVILGDNGTGKTTLLQWLVLMQPNTSQNYSNLSEPNPGLIVGCYPQIAFHSSLKIEELFGRSKSSQSIKSSIICSFPSAVESRGYKNRQGKADIHQRAAEYHSFFDDHQTEASVACFGYGSPRLTRNISLASKGRGHESLFNEDDALIHPTEWLLRINLQQKPGQEERFERVKSFLCQLFPDVQDITIQETRLDDYEVMFHTPYGTHNFEGLSAGYKTMTTWMCDLAYRMEAWYPESKNPLHEPAIVLIDEFDLHLHPKWQQRAMDEISRQFPNVQFIITAHSPLIVQAAAEANFAVLERRDDHVVIRQNDLPDIRYMRIDQILMSDLFGLQTVRRPEVQEKLDERRKILSKPSPSPEELDKLQDLEDFAQKVPFAES